MNICSHGNGRWLWPSLSPSSANDSQFSSSSSFSSSLLHFSRSCSTISLFFSCLDVASTSLLSFGNLSFKLNLSCLTASGEKGPILCGSQPYNLGSAVFSYASCILQGKKKQNFSFSLVHWKREFNPWWVNKSCTMIPVFYSTGCEDWSAKEDSPQEGFTGLTTPHFA